VAGRGRCRGGLVQCRGGMSRHRVLASISSPASWLPPVAARDRAAAAVHPSHRQDMEPSRRQRLQLQLPHVAMEMGTRPSMPGSPSSRSSPSPRSPLPSPLLLRWEELGKKSPGGGGQGKSKGRPGFYTGELGLGEATDGDDHRHPCPWPRGAHPAGRARCGAGDAPPVLFGAGSAHGHREEKGE
jgi:hypothetical protein